MSAIKTTEGWIPNEATERIFSRVDLGAFVQDIDWADAARRFNGPPIPDYVRSSIHGVVGGYGGPDAAATWDAVVKEIFAEYGDDEASTRARLCDAVSVEPATILDVACGTGESTRAWRRRFPEARIVAIDVSPYMLAVAEAKFASDPLVELRCLDASSLPFEDAAFDLVTASLLFHELPREVSPSVLSELARVTVARGTIAVIEPYDKRGRSLHPIPFPEPYLKDFLETDWDVAFKEAGFDDLTVDEYGEGWIRVGTRAR